MSPTAPAGDTVRLVLLGASNLARCLPSALTTARAIAELNHPGSPAWIAVATGRGRSYGQRSMLLGRSLPGVLQSGLWRALEQAPDGPTYALLTDIGNDVIYGATPDRIINWLETCFERLKGESSRFSVTGLPLDNMDRFPVAFLEAFRRVLFPGGTPPVPELLHRAELVDQELQRMCVELDIQRVEQPAEWFGIDPVHYRFRLRHRIWQLLLAPWQAPDRRPLDIVPTRKLIHWRAWHERSSILGKQVDCRQPCLYLPDGTPVSLF